MKNTLLSRALKDAGIEGMDDVLEGTTAIAYSAEDYTAGARILNDFAVKNAAFNIKAGFIDGKVVAKEEVEKLAKLPSKEGLLAQVLYALNGNISGLARALQAIVDKQNGEGDVA